MDWKEFLKPDWKKILLTIGLFLVMPAPFFMPVLCEITGLFGKCNPVIAVKPFGFIQALNLIKSNYTYNFTQISMLLSWAVIFVISYLISCLVVFAYNKYKK